MKRKVTSILLILALVFTMMPAAAMTAYGAINISAQNYDGIKWQIKEGVLYISKGTATNEYDAGEMGDNDMYGYKAWASYKDEITKVVVEEGVTKLGYEACADMPLLTSVEIASSVDIGNYAFARNKALTSVNIKDGVENIGEYAFYDCTALESINIPDSVKAISQYAFYNCSSLTDIAFPSSVKTVGEAALKETPFLNAQIEKGSTFLICGSTLLGTTRTDFYAVDGNPCVIPKGIVCIAEKAFYDVEITELEFPESLKYIDNYAFGGGMRNDYQCIMTDSDIDFKNVEYIGNRAFEYAHYLADLDLSNVTYLGDNAFYWCNHMKTVKLADEMEYLGSSPFAESDSITSITGPKYVKFAYYNSFYTGGAFGSSITDVNGDGYTVYNGILLNATPATEDSEIRIPDGVTTIAHRSLDSFSENSTVMYVPESVKGISFSYNLHYIKDVYYAGDKNGWNAIYMEEQTLNGTPTLFVNATIHYAKSSAVSLDTCNVRLEYGFVTYDGSAKEPKVTVTNPDGKVLTEGTDYTVTYMNNTKAGTAKVIILGVNDYMGTVEKTFSIAQVDGKTLSYSLSYTKTTVNNKVKTPSVTVKDAAGKVLEEGTDYDVDYADGRKAIGKYSVKITMKGNYSGSKTLYFYILPMATSTVKTNLGTGSSGYDDVTVKWDIATGAKGYYLYYKKASASSWTKVDCGTDRTYTKKNLTDGVKYQFKVVAYWKDGSKKIESLKSKTSSIYTLKKLNKPTVKKYSSSKVKVSWSGISGESGYQVYKMKKVNGVYTKVKSYKTTKTYINISATKGKTYYYKVRAYKTNGTKTTYGPWSEMRSYKLPK